MVLYLEALRSNIADYLRLAALIEPFLENSEDLRQELIEAVGVATQNLAVVELLISEGMTEIQVKQIPR